MRSRAAALIITIAAHGQLVQPFCGAKFAAAGLQTAAGVPLQCDEPADFKTFRIGLFGLDKLHAIDRTVANLERALNTIG
jgi:aspartate aminotransferase-like enzyme